MGVRHSRHRLGHLLTPHPFCPLPGPNNSCFLSYRGVWGLNVPPGVPMIQLGERREAGVQAQQAPFGPPPSPPPTPFPPFQDPTIHVSYLIEGFGVSASLLGSL